MQQPPSGSHREGFQAVTLPEASRILGVSESTVRRMVKAGRLEAERVERRQGYVWLVRVPPPSVHGSTIRQEVGAVEGSRPPGSEALSAWTATVLEPLVLELRLSRETIAGQAERLGYVTAERDAARTELDILKASQQPQASNLTAEIPDPIPEPQPAPDPFPAPLPPTPNVVQPALARPARAVELIVVLLAAVAVVAAIVRLYSW